MSRPFSDFCKKKGADVPSTSAPLDKSLAQTGPLETAKIYSELKTEAFTRRPLVIVTGWSRARISGPKGVVCTTSIV